jgi:hypothetical protein
MVVNVGLYDKVRKQVAFSQPAGKLVAQEIRSSVRV